MTSYEYDVAISFLAADEPLARKIRDGLAPLNVFVYSKAQEKVAGSDGTETFRTIFRSKANIAIVLYRPPWGEHGWTQVEAIAIKEHCFENGWEHLFFVMLDRTNTPIWVPKPHIYLDFNTFTLADLVGATKEKLVRLGSVLEPPSPLQIAKQIAERQRFEAETKALLRASPQPFHDAAARLFEELDRRIDEIKGETGWHVRRGASPFREYVAFIKSASLSLEAEGLYLNSADGAYFEAKLFSGRLLTPQERGRYMDWGEHSRLGQRKFYIARLPELNWCWREGEHILTSEAAAAKLLEWHLKHLH